VFAAVVYQLILNAVLGGMITNFPDKPVYNLGGYLSFIFAPVSTVIGDQRYVSGNAPSATVSFVAGRNWLSGYATRETLVFTEEPQFDDNGNFYNLTIAGFVPGDNPQLEQILYEMENQRHLVVLKDAGGVLRLAGSKKQPLSFSASFASGGARSDIKGYNFKFTGSASLRAPQYND
jgi:hypothetical protein